MGIGFGCSQSRYRRDEQREMKAEIITLDNAKAGSMELSDKIFGLPLRPDILARVVCWQLAKRRAGTHTVKSVSDVHASTAKLGRQKGSGRARHGSRKANLFRGGAVVHGPVQRAHTFKLPKRIRALGLKIAFSTKKAEGKLLIFENCKLKDEKTNTLSAKLSVMGIADALILEGNTIDCNFSRAASNISDIDILPSVGANVYDILRHDLLILTKDAVGIFEELFK